MPDVTTILKLEEVTPTSVTITRSASNRVTQVVAVVGTLARYTATLSRDGNDVLTGVTFSITAP